MPFINILKLSDIAKINLWKAVLRFQIPLPKKKKKLKNPNKASYLDL